MNPNAFNFPATDFESAFANALNRDVLPVDAIPASGIPLTPTAGAVVGILTRRMDAGMNLSLPDTDGRKGRSESE